MRGLEDDCVEPVICTWVYMSRQPVHHLAQVANTSKITVRLLPLALGLPTYTPNPASSDSCPPVFQLLRFLPPPSEATPHCTLQAFSIGQTRTFGAEAIHWRLLVARIKPTRLSSPPPLSANLQKQYWLQIRTACYPAWPVLSGRRPPLAWLAMPYHAILCLFRASPTTA
ncbi:hypothetical protein CSAL01_12006 [Colletotrichum salicis]|uniref:Uncharacterized protein n=1 Tax=Colletotrichum salicis TaxID=1209931 RepID=A0A135UG86_9PEZI|nr:hypothetical protein CSAL01_12006 [Colletotrichum salicis]